MNKHTLLTTAVASLFFIAVGANTGFAQKSGHMSGHQSINSGRDFGQHVRKNNKKFSGDHNPGKHHKGYSTLKK